jgi:hypothetical protein
LPAWLDGRKTAENAIQPDMSDFAILIEASQHRLLSKKLWRTIYRWSW